MELEVLGIGNAFSCVHYHTSFLIRSRRNFLIDAPHSLFRLLQERGIPRDEIDDVILTHVHGDHVAGLETLLLWKKHFAKTKVRLYTSAPIFEELKRGFFHSFGVGFTADLQGFLHTGWQDYVEFMELAEGQVNQLDQDLTVEIRHNWHPTPTLGMKFSGRGGTIAVSGDTCYRPALLTALRERGLLTDTGYESLAGNWLWEADLILHEADDNEKGPHTFVGDLLALPADIRRKIRLVHIPDDFQEEGIALASEGQRFSLS